MSKYNDLKRACYEANMELNALGLVIYTFGNVSAVDRAEAVFAIKPSGVPYEVLSPDDIVVLDYDNKVVEGSKRPSSDTKTHAWLYKNWPEIGGIAHTHATYSVAWAQAQRDIPIFGTTHADHLTQDIPCAEPMRDDLIEGNYAPVVDEETGEITEPDVAKATQAKAAEKPAEPAKAKTAPAAKADAAKAEDAPNPKLKVIFDLMAAAKTIEALDEIYIRAEGELDGTELEALMREYRKCKSQDGLF